MGKYVMNSITMSHSNVDPLTASESDSLKPKRKDTPTIAKQTPLRGKMIFQGHSREGPISLSVEEVEEPDNAREEESDEEDFELSASRIRIVENSYDKPRKSSFRARKGVRRQTSVKICEDPVVVDDVTKNEETCESSACEITDIKENEVSHLEVAKANLTLWSKIRRDSLDNITVKKEKEEDSLETKKT